MAIAAALVLAGAPSPGAHVLAGARLFRESQYAEALVEFRVAERLGAPDAQGYAAASLLKLDRPLDALALFEERRAGAARNDALLDYYHALACYAARLYVCADDLLAGIAPRIGPRIAAQTANIRADIAGALAAEPATDSIDWYVGRAEDHLRAGRAVLARAFFREARALGARRRDGHGVATADARLVQLARAAPEPR